MDAGVVAEDLKRNGWFATQISGMPPNLPAEPLNYPVGGAAELAVKAVPFRCLTRILTNIPNGWLQPIWRRRLPNSRGLCFRRPHVPADRTDMLDSGDHGC
jgi:hypothetical protein